MKLPCTKKPCANCPFRKDSLEGWLEERIEEILEADSFVCHKKTNLQCSGFMLVKKEESSFYRLATKIVKGFKLKGSELVFNSKENCIKHHKNSK